MSFGFILNTRTNPERNIIRKIEKVYYKINSAEAAILFNKTCLNEGLLPRYIDMEIFLVKTW